MKKAEQYFVELCEQLDCHTPLHAQQAKAIIRRIQADALRHAASHLQANWMATQAILNEADALDPICIYCGQGAVNGKHTAADNTVNFYHTKCVPEADALDPKEGK